MLDYNLDISSSSMWQTYTPTVAAKSFPFYMSECGYFDAGRDYYTMRDGKQSALLLFTCSGMGEIKYKNMHGVLAPNSAVIIDCVDLHDYRTVSVEPWVFYWIHIEGNGLISYYPSLFDRLEVVSIAGRTDFQARFRDLMALEMQSGLVACAQASHYISELLLSMLQAQTIGLYSDSAGRDEIRASLEYIRSNYDKQVTLNDILRVANLSKYHFIRVFKRQVGVTPYQYLQQYRIDQAKILLRSSNLSINEIAAMTGYNDVSNFVAHFRGISGSTPAKYRKESYRWIL